MEKLIKEEEAVQRAGSNYQGNPTTANGKAFFAAIKALRNYIQSHDGQPAGYTQFGKNLGKKVQMAIKGEIKEAIYGVRPDGK